MKKILFLCTGNSCRSQIAEAWARSMGFNAYSAGTRPEKKISKNTKLVMLEEGIDISMQYPKSINDINLEEINILITVCSNAEKNCPILTDFRGKIIRLEFEDPTKVKLSEKAKIQFFRKIRDEIKTSLLLNL
ncbi:MAG: arsenate reductase ArsC [Candidatus Neomarinimicrobiota bacterium]|nr:arsenate reductase ArsC [Candidatus Neomarinimicrobiota bacterium]